MKETKRLIDIISNGDMVSITTRHGTTLKGRAVMRSSSDGWVLNGGGKYGTPLLADNENTIKVIKKK